MFASRAKFMATAGALATPAPIRYPAGAAEFSWKFALKFPVVGFPPALRAIEAADKITKDTGGRLEIKTFPNSQLGDGPQLLTQLRAGAIEATLTPSSDMTSLIPVIGMFSLPFLVSSHEQGVSLLGGPLGGYIHNAFTSVGMFELPGAWDIGFQEVENYLRPINVPADFKGMKLRTTNAATEIAVIRTFGATPTPVATAEIYTGIQTHLVDGTTLPVAQVQQFRIFEVAKYLSLTNHSWVLLSMVINPGAWAALPKNLQDIVARDFDAARITANTEMKSSDSTSVDFCKAHGMSVNTVDPAPFRKEVASAGLYEQWKKTYPPDAWAMLERVVGKLG